MGFTIRVIFENSVKLLEPLFEWCKFKEFLYYMSRVKPAVFHCNIIIRLVSIIDLKLLVLNVIYFKP